MFSGNDDNFDDFFKTEEEKIQKQQKEQLDKLNDFYRRPFSDTNDGSSKSGQSEPSPQQSGYGFGYRQQQPNFNADYGSVHQRSSKNKRIVLIAVAAILMVAVFFLGMLVQDLAWNSNRGLISDVEKLINDWGFIYESDDPYEHDLYYQAAKAMLESIDKHSTLLTPEEYYSFMNPVDMSAAAHGISYTKYNMDYEIYEVQINGPAYNAGLFAGDIVTGIQVKENGVWKARQNINYKTDVDNFVAYIRNDEIVLYVERDGSSSGVKVPDIDTSNNSTAGIKKAVFTPADVDYYFGSGSGTNMSAAYITRNFKGGNSGAVNILDGTNVGYIRLTTFMSGDENSGPEVDFLLAMNRFRNTPGKAKLILDLRDNGGGSVAVCNDIAQYLIFDKNNPGAESLTVSTNKYKDGSTDANKTKSVKFGTYFETNYSSPPIAVLTNGNSASASEALLGAMLDYGTAVQVGTKTYGKSIAQTVIDVGPTKLLQNGERWPYGAYMTILEFYTPLTQVCHQKIGFTPAEENVVTGFSAQVARAVNLLK